MELEAILAISMFLVAIGALLAGYPVALTLGGVASNVRNSGEVEMRQIAPSRLWPRWLISTPLAR